ncbi:MAG TPA: DMT family transporter [Nitrospirota bacterium]|nr:DMT family transporter [Nitrospirota bacterium]
MFDIRLLFVAVAWGVNFSVVKYALAEFEPLAFTLVRFTLAGVFLLAVMRVGNTPFAIDRKDRFSVAMLGLTGIALYNIFFMYGLRFTSASNSALLISLSPLAGALFQSAAGKEKITIRMCAGLCLATAGVVMIIRSHHHAFTLSSASIKGDLLTLCATFAWALYTIRAKPLLGKYPSLTITAYSMLGGSIMLLPAGMPELINQRWSAVSTASWTALAFSVFIAGGLAYVFWYDGVKRIGVTRTMAYHYLMPFAAVLFSALALKENVTPLQIAGGAAILTGVYLVQKKSTP